MISLTKPPFGVRSCEVAIIWPDQYGDSLQGFQKNQSLRILVATKSCDRGSCFTSVFFQVCCVVFTKPSNYKKYLFSFWYEVTGWCSTLSLLLICSSFSGENGHPLLICSSLSTTQVIYLDSLRFQHHFQQMQITYVWIILNLGSKIWTRGTKNRPFGAEIWKPLEGLKVYRYIHIQNISKYFKIQYTSVLFHLTSHPSPSFLALITLHDANEATIQAYPMPQAISGSLPAVRLGTVVYRNYITNASNFSKILQMPPSSAKFPNASNFSKISGDLFLKHFGFLSFLCGQLAGKSQ